MSIATSVEIPGDAELISAVRGGDVDAYGHLFERHVEAARRLARQVVAAGDVEDLVSEAFIKVLGILQRGGGPDVAFRAYLLTSVRSLRVDRFRAGARLQTTDDMEAFDPGVPFRDTVVEGFENGAAARAFASLPERWQLVLWHTEVEGDKPADIAPLLGMSPNSVSALAYRAREGLRQAFLNEHAAELDEDTCRWTHQHLGAYIRNGIARRDAAKVEDHLGECRACMAIYLELTEVNSNLGGLLAPLLLGGAATAYVGTAGGVVLPFGAGLVVGRLRDLVAGNSAVVAVAGVAATVAVVGSTLALGLNDSDRRPTDAPAAVSVLPGVDAEAPDPAIALEAPNSDVATPDDTVVVDVTATDAPTARAETPGGADPTGGADPSDQTGPTDGSSPTATTTSDPTSDPTTDPTGSPTSNPTGNPTSNPTGDATSTATPTSNPTGNPTGNPTSNPTVAPTSTPPTSTPPTSTPPPPTTTPGADVSLGGQFVSDRPNYRVHLEVSGLPAGTPATLVVSTTGAVVLKATDARCSVIGDVATCAVSGPTTVEMAAIAPRGGAIEAEIRVTEPDPDPGNNIWRGLLD